MSMIEYLILFTCCIIVSIATCVLLYFLFLAKKEFNCSNENKEDILDLLYDRISSVENKIAEIESKNELDSIKTEIELIKKDASEISIRTFDDCFEIKKQITSLKETLTFFKNAVGALKL